jgi:hypothetical protein
VHNVLPGLVGWPCDCLQRRLAVAQNGDGLALQAVHHLAFRYLFRDHLDRLMDSNEFSRVDCPECRWSDADLTGLCDLLILV